MPRLDRDAVTGKVTLAARRRLKGGHLGAFFYQIFYPQQTLMSFLWFFVLFSRTLS